MARAQARLQTCTQLSPRRSTALSALAPCGASALASERARWPNGEGVGLWSRSSQVRVLGGSVLLRVHFFPPGAAWKMSLRWDTSPRPPAYCAGALPTKLKRLARGKAIPPVGWTPVFFPVLRVSLVRAHFRWSLAALTATLRPSGCGDGLEIHWALPAGVQIPSASSFRSCLCGGNSSGGGFGCSFLPRLSHPRSPMAKWTRRRTSKGRSGCPSAVTPTPARVAIRHHPQRSTLAATRESAEVMQQRQRGDSNPHGQSPMDV